MRYFNALFRWSSRGMWILYIECLISITWAFLILLHLVYLPVELVTETTNQSLHDLSPSWTSMLLSITCLFQFAVSLAIDSRYEARTGSIAKYYYWMVWYPVIYWLINVGTTIAGSIKALKKKRGQRALWVTLDRGIRNK